MVTEAPSAPHASTSRTGRFREPLRSAAAITLIGGWAGYLLFTGMPQLSLHVFPRTLALHLMVAALALAYVIALAATRRLPGGSPLDLPLLAFVAAYAIATAASVSWRVSLEPVLYIGAAMIVFYTLSDVPFVTARDLRGTLAITGTALAAYALWVVGNDYADYLRLVRRVEGLDAGNIFPPTVPRVHDVSDHPNVLAMVLAAVVPFVTLSALRGARMERIAGVLALLVCGMASFLTLSRGGWLGAGAGIAFTAIGVWLTLQAYERERQGFAPSWENALPRDISPTALAAIGGAIVLIGGGTLAFLSNASTRPGWLFRGSLSPREDAWDAALSIFADDPLTGAGPHAFGLLYPQESGKFLVHTQHAHNGFLQVADDAGVLGLLALAAIALVVAFMLLRVWREGDLTQRLSAVACAGALIGFCAHNLVDAGNIWKAPPIALAIVGAIIVRLYRERAPSLVASAEHTATHATSEQTDPPSLPAGRGSGGGVPSRADRETSGTQLTSADSTQSGAQSTSSSSPSPPAGKRSAGGGPSRADREPAGPPATSRSPFTGRGLGGGVSLAARAALLALLFVPFAAWWRVDRAHNDYYAGADAYNEGDIEEAIARLQDGVDRDSSNMVYRMLLGQAQAQRYNETGRADPALIRDALVNLEQAKRLDPRSDLARANLARAYQLAGRDADAAEQAQITRLAAHHVPPVLAVAEVYEDLGREEEAISTYGQVLSMDASLANSEFWELTPWRREHFEEILDASILGLNPCTFGGFLVERLRADPDAPADELAPSAEGCKLLLFSAPNDLTLRVALAKIQSVLGNRQDAFGHLRYAVDRQPDFGPARTELGRWYVAEGDLEAARHEWVIGEQLNEPESVMLLGESYRPQDRPAYLTGRLRDLLAGFGSSVQNDVISILYYRLRYGRLSPWAASIPATWQTAVPRVYAEMRETLTRWEAGD